MSHVDSNTLGDTISGIATSLKEDPRIEAHEAADLCCRLNAIRRDIASAISPEAAHSESIKPNEILAP